MRSRLTEAQAGRENGSQRQLSKDPPESLPAGLTNFVVTGIKGGGEACYKLCLVSVEVALVLIGVIFSSRSGSARIDS
jgi:hypothetical protein